MDDSVDDYDVDKKSTFETDYSESDGDIDWLDDDLSHGYSTNDDFENKKLVADVIDQEISPYSVHHLHPAGFDYKTNDATTGSDSDYGEIDSIADTIVTCEQPVCRICLEHGSELLVSPCKCDGSAKYIHETCLLTWFHKTRRKRCEICLSKVNIKSVGCKPVIKWRIPKGTYNFVFYFYVIYALATFCTSGIAFTVAVTNKCTSPTCIALYIACILSVFSLVYCAGFTIYIKLFWKAAITTNRNWKVYDRAAFAATEKNLCSESMIDKQDGSEYSPSDPSDIDTVDYQPQTGTLCIDVPDSSANNNGETMHRNSNVSQKLPSSLQSNCEGDTTKNQEKKIWVMVNVEKI